MALLDDPAEDGGRTLFDAPTCPQCGVAHMRLLTVEPHSQLKMLDVETYECDCGFSAHFTVARILHRPV
jgi:hypothetical protein